MARYIATGNANHRQRELFASRQSGRMSLAIICPTKREPHGSARPPGSARLDFGLAANRISCWATYAGDGAAVPVARSGRLADLLGRDVGAGRVRPVVFSRELVSDLSGQAGAA